MQILETQNIHYKDLKPSNDDDFKVKFLWELNKDLDFFKVVITIINYSHFCMFIFSRNLPDLWNLCAKAIAPGYVIYIKTPTEFTPKYLRYFFKLILV